MILDMIKDALKDHIILNGYGETEHVYDWHACAEIKALLDDHMITNSVFVYPINTEKCHEADYWCCATWMEAGILQSYGWNWMSAERKYALDKFEEIGDLKNVE